MTTNLTIDDTYGYEITYRRPINVGEGYRLVGLDEVIQKEDQFLIVDGVWTSIQVPSSYNMTVREASLVVWPYRAIRRVVAVADKPLPGIRDAEELQQRAAQSATPLNGWIAIKDRKPELPCRCGYWNGSVWGEATFQNSARNIANYFTHWQPYTEPPQPKPPESPMEKAWKACRLSRYATEGWIALAEERGFSAGFQAAVEIVKALPLPDDHDQDDHDQYDAVVKGLTGK